MSMSRASRNEMNKLRELVHFLLQGAGSTRRKINTDELCCYFCCEGLGGYADGSVQHGNATGPKLDIKLTIHHIDGNHENCEPLNEALCHTSCHRRYHRQLTNEQERIKRAVLKGEAK